jgi:hypothetical protein
MEEHSEVVLQLGVVKVVVEGEAAPADQEQQLVVMYLTMPPSGFMHKLWESTLGMGKEQQGPQREVKTLGMRL